jgi:nucleoside-diphosphate-sugar epimerase
MNIGVTGSTSLVGRALTMRLQESGYSVVEFGGKNSEIWTLGEPIPTNLSIDALVHLAHDRSTNLEENLIATDRIVESFSGYKVVLSSMSAHAKTKSVYGISKKYAEERFENSGGVALKAGIIFGPETGGVFKTLQAAVTHLPIVPLPFSGLPKLFVTHIEDLCDEILFHIKHKDKAIVFAAHPWPYSLKWLVLEIGKNIGKNTRLVAVNSFLTNLLLFTLEKLCIRTPSTDGLRSLSCEIENSEVSQLQLPNAIFREFN